MVRLELQVAVLLVTSCLAAIQQPPDAPLSPLCQDLKNVAEWSAHKGNGLQYSNLLKVCMEAGSEGKKSEHNADDIVREMIKCIQIEHNHDTSDPIKKTEVDKCIHDLNCKKRCYMEVAKLRPEAYHKEFPLIWKGAEVKVDSPPSETFIDGDPSNPTCPCQKTPMKTDADHDTPPPPKEKFPPSPRMSKMVSKGVEPATAAKKESIFLRIIKFIKCIFTKC